MAHFMLGSEKNEDDQTLQVGIQKAYFLAVGEAYKAIFRPTQA